MAYRVDPELDKLHIYLSDAAGELLAVFVREEEAPSCEYVKIRTDLVVEIEDGFK